MRDRRSQGARDLPEAHENGRIRSAGGARSTRAGRAGLGQRTILVADAAPGLRSAVRAVLTRETRFKVVQVANLAELELAVAAERPDVLLIDAALPPEGGIAATARIAGRCDAPAIVWSFRPRGETVLAAVRAGAAGYLEKEISPRGLVRALFGVVRGEAALSRQLAALMIAALHTTERRDRASRRTETLSLREREVLALVAGGARNGEIAEALAISEFTVKRHVQNILHKLDVPSRRAAAVVYRSATAEPAIAELTVA